jgi:ribonucleoside-diphosphate reductase alpha chain
VTIEHIEVTMSSTIKKKSGKLEPFIRAKIHKGIKQAMKEVRHSDHSEKITEEVVKFLNKRFKDIVPTVHDIKDVVEDILIKHRMHDVAKAYILHRKQVGEGQYFSAKEEGNLSVNAITVLQKRYLRRNIKGEVVETTAQMFSRVAKHVASAEKKKDKNKWEEEFLGIMEELDFLPNTPCLINAGTSLNQLFSCFVLDVPDSMEEIFETLKQSALIFKSGGGVGYSFSNIRHSGALVNSTGRTASGPVTFMEVYDKATEVIKKGGVRRGSIMGVLRVDHPDILTFVGEKAK